MALVPLMASSQGLDQLLENMAPNSAPLPPSIWPLAIGYWLIAGGVLVLITALTVWYFKRRPWRRLLRELQRLQTLNSPQQQLIETHQLLRWLSIHCAAAPKDMTTRQFAQWIGEHNNGQVPAWLNRHYEPDAANTTLPWPEVTTVAKALFKGGRS